MAVHSVQLGYNDALGASEVSIYGVPTGYRTIWKSILAFNDFSGANRLYTNIYNGSTQKGSFSTDLAALFSPGDGKHVDLWVVLDEGDVIKMQAVSNHVRVILSGAELLL